MNYFDLYSAEEFSSILNCAGVQSSAMKYNLKHDGTFVRVDKCVNVARLDAFGLDTNLG